MPATQLRPLAARRSTGSATRGARPSPRDLSSMPPRAQKPERTAAVAGTAQLNAVGPRVPTGQHPASSFSQAVQKPPRIIYGHLDLQSSTPSCGRGRGGAEHGERVSDSLKAEEGGLRGSELRPAQRAHTGLHNPLSSLETYHVTHYSEFGLLPSISKVTGHECTTYY